MNENIVSISIFSATEKIEQNGIIKGQKTLTLGSDNKNSRAEQAYKWRERGKLVLKSDTICSKVLSSPPFSSLNSLPESSNPNIMAIFSLLQLLENKKATWNQTQPLYITSLSRRNRHTDLRVTTSLRTAEVAARVANQACIFLHNIINYNLVLYFPKFSTLVHQLCRITKFYQIFLLIKKYIDLNRVTR